MGLALAGGGFRASLFHIGVLRRMAELDLLRHVEVLSAVSGGSIVGAMYTLALKEALKDSINNGLAKSDYIKIVLKVQQKLCEGIRKDIRTRLLVNPFRVLWMIVSWSGLGAHLATLIDRHFLGADRWPRRRRKSIRLSEARVGSTTTDADAHNRSVLRTVIESLEARTRHGDPPLPSALTKLVINATCLNSGDRFWFSHDEIGDWRLGHFAADEIKRIEKLGPVWKHSNADVIDACQKAQARGSADINGISYSFRELWAVARLRWLRARAAAQRSKIAVPAWPDMDAPREWKDVASEHVLERLALLQDLGYLRAAKNAAKTLAGQPSDDIKREATDRLRRALVAIDDTIADALAPLDSSDIPQPSSVAFEFVEQIYIATMAGCASRKAQADFNRWRLAQAVAASANFPPILPPYKIFGFFDDWYVSRLGLTDGGVFENCGVQALLDENCTCVIVSDPGSPFSPRRRSSVGRAWMMRRIVDTVMTGVSWRQRMHVDTLWTAGVIDTYAWIDIDGPRRTPRVGKPPVETALDGHALARLRTDLDAFGTIEIAALINHGYDCADRYLRRYVIDDGHFAAVADVEAEPKLPHEFAAGTRRLERILWAGRWRFAKPLLMLPPWVMAIGAAAAVFAMWWFGANVPSLSWRSLQAVARKCPVPEITPYSLNAWLFAAGAAVIAAALTLEWIGAPGIVLKRWGERPWVVRSRFGLIIDRVRGLGFNLLWLLPPFPLPFWIALAVSFCAWLKYALITLPFRWMTSAALDSNLTNRKIVT